MSLFLLVVFHDPQTQSSEIGKLIKFYLWCPMNEFIKTIIQMYTLENQHYIYICEIKFKQVFNYMGEFTLDVLSICLGVECESVVALLFL